MIPWSEVGLFSLGEMTDRAVNHAPAQITALVGLISQEIADRTMLPYWIGLCRILHARDRQQSEHIDIGGEA
jgi:hypothetical protein